MAGKALPLGRLGPHARPTRRVLRYAAVAPQAARWRAAWGAVIPSSGDPVNDPHRVAARSAGRGRLTRNPCGAPRVHREGIANKYTMQGSVPRFSVPEIDK